MMDSSEKSAIKYDGTLALATGKSRRDTNWKNRDISWSDLVERLSKTHRTYETYAEYLKMTKKEQTEVKDSAGGFVGGTLKGGHRKLDTVAWRHLITLDADFAYPDMWDDFTVLNSYACAVYSTHKHSPEKPRLRFVIPLSRPITPDEYSCISRALAGDIGIDYFDPTTYEPHRLMFWPTTSSDGEFIFKLQDGPWLNPDEVLKRYEDWRDQSFWPESELTKNRRQRLAEKQGDPLGKPGIIGVFCRTYSIPDAIETFLGDVYEQSGEGRYTYLRGTSVGGLVLYDNAVFAYSHHGTDPIGGLLVNAFDLVRIHKFGDLDENAEPDTPINRLPSFSAMSEMANEDERVLQQISEEKLIEAGIDFGESDRSWLKKLQRNKQTWTIKSNAHNIKLVMRKDPNLADKMALDLFAHRVVLLADMPWRSVDQGKYWGDLDDAALRNYLSEAYSIQGRSVVLDGLTEITQRNAFHPIQDYLNGATWDGVERLDSVLIDYLGADASAYVKAVTRKTLVAAVARVFEPGIKFDYMLTLVGPQGHGKSELISRLGRDWYTDSVNTVLGKEAYEQLQGAWIAEMAELAAIRRVEVEAIKHFISKKTDRYRAAYGRNVMDYPRQCIFIATTNEQQFLRDKTGNRRFWIVEIDNSKAKKSIWEDLDNRTVAQIWAEAVKHYKEDEPLYLSGDIAREAEEHQATHSEEDEKLGLISEFLDRPIPENWDDLDLGSRRAFLQGGFGAEDEDSLCLRERTCAMEIWVECFGRDPAWMTPAQGREIISLLRKAPGWVPYEKVKMRFKNYGIQRAFVRE